MIITACHIHEILKSCHMRDCMSANNPMFVDLNLPKLEVTTLEGVIYPYCSAVGKLNYLTQVASPCTTSAASPKHGARSTGRP
jgi:hypothetical protein